MRHNNSGDAQYKQICTILTNLAAPNTVSPESGSDPTNQEESVYVRITDNGKATVCVCVCVCTELRTLYYD